MTPVTLVPMMPEIVVVPVPLPKLLIVPTLPVAEVAETVKLPLLFALNVTLPVPVMAPAPIVVRAVPDEVIAKLPAPTVMPPLTIKGELLLACVIVLTVLLTGALMVVVPAPVPELVMVPVLPTAVVEAVMPPVLLALKIRLPVPAIPPESVKSAVPEEVKVVPAVVSGPLTVSGEVLLVSRIPVTLLPTGALMVVVPVPAPLFVMVPTLLTAVVEIVVVAVVVAFEIVKLPVPVMPPLTVVEPVPPEAIVNASPFMPIAPLKTAAVAAALLPMVSVPTALVPRLIGLETVNELASKLAEPPVELPKVIALAEGPAAPLTVVALLILANAVPDLINRPPFHVLAPLKVKDEVALFWMTPVTFVPMTALISAVPAPVPWLVIVPVLFTAVVRIVMPLAVAILFCRIRLPVPVTPPATCKSAFAPPPAFVSVVPTAPFTVTAVVVIFRPEDVLLTISCVTFAPIPPVMSEGVLLP